jgi:Tol biopolymer transport system component
MAFAQTTPGQTKAPTAAGADDRFQDKLLARIPAIYGEVVGANVKVLPDGKTFGYLAHKGAKYAVVYGGKEVTELDPVDVWQDPHRGGGILFSGKRNGKWVYVLGDAVHEVPSESTSSFRVSRSGEHWGYADPVSGKQGEWDSLNVDGKRYGPFKGNLVPRTLVVGDDGSFAVNATVLGTNPRLINGAGTQTPYKSLSDPVLAPDGKTLVYLAETEQGGKLLLFVGNAVKREYDGYSQPFGTPLPIVSADSQSIAFYADRNDSPRRQCVMVDDRCGELFDSTYAIRFLEGTHTVLYQASSGQQNFTVVGDRKFEGLCPYVSANGKTVARVDISSKTIFHEHGAEMIDESTIIVNGVAQIVKGLVSGLALSPDGDALAYVIESREWDSNTRRPRLAGAMVVRGDSTGARFPGIINDSLTFSPNGKSLAYVVNFAQREDAGGRMVVVNGRKSEEFDWILTPLIFSPDGSKLAFGALKGRDILWKVISTAGEATAPRPKSLPAKK